MTRTIGQRSFLRGPQIGVATPFFKQPPETGTKGRPQDLTTLPDDALPRSEYTRATDIETFRVHRTNGWTTTTGPFVHIPDFIGSCGDI